MSQPLKLPKIENELVFVTDRYDPNFGTPQLKERPKKLILHNPELYLDPHDIHTEQYDWGVYDDYYLTQSRPNTVADNIRFAKELPLDDERPRTAPTNQVFNNIVIPRFEQKRAEMLRAGKILRKANEKLGPIRLRSIVNSTEVKEVKLPEKFHDDTMKFDKKLAEKYQFSGALKHRLRLGVDNTPILQKPYIYQPEEIMKANALRLHPPESVLNIWQDSEFPLSNTNQVTVAHLETCVYRNTRRYGYVFEDKEARRKEKYASLLRARRVPKRNSVLRKSTMTNAVIENIPTVNDIFRATKLKTPRKSRGGDSPVTSPIIPNSNLPEIPLVQTVEPEDPEEWKELKKQFSEVAENITIEELKNTFDDGDHHRSRSNSPLLTRQSSTLSSNSSQDITVGTNKRDPSPLQLVRNSSVRSIHSDSAPSPTPKSVLKKESSRSNILSRGASMKRVSIQLIEEEKTEDLNTLTSVVGALALEDNNMSIDNTNRAESSPSPPNVGIHTKSGRQATPIKLALRQSSFRQSFRESSQPRIDEVPYSPKQEKKIQLSVTNNVQDSVETSPISSATSSIPGSRATSRPITPKSGVVLPLTLTNLPFSSSFNLSRPSTANSGLTSEPLSARTPGKDHPLLIPIEPMTLDKIRKSFDVRDDEEHRLNNNNTITLLDYPFQSLPGSASVDLIQAGEFSRPGTGLSLKLPRQSIDVDDDPNDDHDSVNSQSSKSSKNGKRGYSSNPTTPVTKNRSRSNTPNHHEQQTNSIYLPEHQQQLLLSENLLHRKLTPVAFSYNSQGMISEIHYQSKLPKVRPNSAERTMKENRNHHSIPLLSSPSKLEQFDEFLQSQQQEQEQESGNNLSRPTTPSQLGTPTQRVGSGRKSLRNSINNQNSSFSSLGLDPRVEQFALLNSPQPQQSFSQPFGLFKEQIKRPNSHRKDLSNLKFISEDDKVRERSALMSIYDMCYGDEWYRQDNWGSTLDVRYWYGVGVTVEGYVFEINLSNNNLKGKFPDNLIDFPYLEKIQLDHNHLSGLLPDYSLQCCENLKILSACYNELEGNIPFTLLSDCTKLKEIWLNDNQFTGPIEEGLYDITTLTHLCVDNNQLTGNISPKISKLQNLIYLSLGRNQLSGTIPQAIVSLQDLQTLSLHSNQFEGKLPLWIDVIPKLDELRLYNNPKLINDLKDRTSVKSAVKKKLLQ